MLSLRPRSLVAAICVAEVMSMIVFSCFAALLPILSEKWRLCAVGPLTLAAVVFAGPRRKAATCKERA